jgi:ribokinase
MTYDIVTFGSAVVDTFVNTDAKEVRGFIEYPVGSKLLIKEQRRDIGGGATNTATAFSRLGFKTGCICNVGKDNNGKDILNLLKKEKITFLGSVKKEETGYSIILDSLEHDRTILTYKGPNDSIGIKDIPKFKTKWVYYTSMMKTSYETQRKLTKTLAKEGVRIVFNPSAYLIRNKDIRDILKSSYAVILNKEEADMICKKYGKKGDSLKALVSFGPKVAVVTDKDNPARAYDGDKVYSIQPHTKIKVLERTGAGDAFGAGFTAGLMMDYSMDECLKLALLEGESVLKHYGAKNNLIRKQLTKRETKK